MKIEDLAYAIAGETIALLEKKFHYRIPADQKQEVQAEIRDNLDAVMKHAQGKE